MLHLFLVTAAFVFCDCYIHACDHCIWGAYWIFVNPLSGFYLLVGGGGRDSPQTPQLPPVKFCQLNLSEE